MRIAVTSWSANRVGGVESYLSRILPLLREEGHQTFFFTEHRPSTAPLDEGEGASVEALGEPAALGRLSTFGADVLFGHGLLSPELESKTFTAAPRSVYFAHAHSGICISGLRAHSFPAVKVCDRAFGPACLAHYLPRRCGGRSPVTMVTEYRLQQARLDVIRRYDQVITASDEIRRLYVRQGLSEARVERIIYLASGTAQTPSAPPDRRVLRLLWAGRMDRLKGGSALIEALPRVVSKLNLPMQVIFAGDGPERAAWEAKAQQLQARDPRLTIEFPGWIADPGALQASVHLVVMPSLWPEPFGLVGPEAGLRGTPAIAFDVGGVRDWLNDGVNGVLARAGSVEGLADAIVEAFSDEQGYLRLRAGAVRMANRFRRELHLPSLLSALTGVPEAARRP